MKNANRIDTEKKDTGVENMKSVEMKMEGSRPPQKYEPSNESDRTIEPNKASVCHCSIYRKRNKGHL